MTEPEALALRYRKRQTAPHESRWLPQVHRLPTYRPGVASETENRMRPGDRLSFARFAIGDVAAWAPRVVPVELVFAADPAQRRAWFAGRAVLIGQMIPPLDQWRFQQNVTVFGCQVQATVLDGLLRDTYFYRANRLELLARILPCAALAVLVTRKLPVPGTWRRRITVPVSLALVLLAFVAAGTLTEHLNHRPALETLIAGTALIASGTAALLIRLLHERQLHLAPGNVWSAEDSTASATPWTGSTHTPPAAPDEPGA